MNLKWPYLSLIILIVLVALAGCGRAQRGINAEMIHDALAETRDFPTILGNFSFDANGEAMYDPVVLIVKDGALQAFE